MKHQMRLSIVLVLLVLGTTVFSPLAQAANGPTVTVNTAALNVRQGPGTTYTVIDLVHMGDSLAVTGRDAAAGWYQVSLADGRTGWVSASLVTLTGDGSSIPQVAGQAATPAVSTSSGLSTGGAGARGGTIVFQVSSGGAIYAVGADGSNLRYLTAGMDPALSPDSQWVAFTRWEGQNNGVGGSLWVINVNGSGERKVLAGANQAKSPTWSADGTQVVIGVQQGGQLSDKWICMVNGKPTELPQPIEGQRCMKKPADPYWGLRLVNVATGAFEDLPDDRHSFGPTWDPANAWRVVYRGDRGLKALDLNQKTTTLLKESGGYRGPVFSPDGSKIAVTFKQNDHWEVHVMNADGSGEVRLTETPMTIIIDQQLQGKDAHAWNNAAPAWSPDGSQIAFLSDRNGSYEIWIMNADGSGQHPLVSSDTIANLHIQYIGVDERVISWR